MKRDDRAKGKRPGRKFIMVELKPSEREKLDRLVAARGERGTIAGVVRELIMKARE